MPNLQKLKKKELAKMCEKEGLSAAGNKNVLINRLQINNEYEDNYQSLSSAELLERINLLEKTVTDLRTKNCLVPNRIRICNENVYCKYGSK